MRALIILLICLFAAPVPADERDGDGPVEFDDRPSIGHPVVFRDEHGGIFRPRTLVIATPDGGFIAPLPDTAKARSENRVDLSDVPVLGDLFQDRRAPSDVEREGQLLGPVYHDGEQLILDGRQSASAASSARVILTATLPRDDTISMDLGLLSFSLQPVEVSGIRVGAAYLFRGALVIAADGARPLITDWGVF